MNSQFAKLGFLLVCMVSVQPVLAKPLASKSGFTSRTYRYDKKVRLTGYIVKKMFPGPPNYESIKQGDKPEEFWILRLVNPVTVLADLSNPDEETARNVSEMQLMLDDKGYRKYRKYVGSRRLVTITCELMARHTRYHRTQVLANALTPTPPPSTQRVAKVKTKTKPQIRMPGQFLRAIVSTMGSEPNIRQDLDIRTAQFFNKAFTSLRVSKETSKGLLHISFNFGNKFQGGESVGNWSQEKRFLIRLFDTNRNYLNHFQTAVLLNPGGSGKGSPGFRAYTFEINTRDLRDTAVVEFGFAP